jgi:CubicO group peptidase (beta-lactamase class C family)
MNHTVLTTKLAFAVVVALRLLSTFDGREHACAQDPSANSVATERPPLTRVSLANGSWRINDRVTYPGTLAEGLLMNVRMVNSVFEDVTRPDFDADANTQEFIDQISQYVAHGVRAFTLNLQGGDPGYEGAVNSAFHADGTLRAPYLARVRRVIEACDKNGTVVILGCFYQRQDQILKDEQAVRDAVVNTANWIENSGFTNVVLEIANEYGHGGFNHRILKTASGQVDLIQLVKKTSPRLLVSTSSLGDGRIDPELVNAVDFLMPHLNSTNVDEIPQRMAVLKQYGKPVLCNEDDKVGRLGAQAAEACVKQGCSWGFMHVKVNQHHPFTFRGAADDHDVYTTLRRLTTTRDSAIYFPPPESKGGWRKLTAPDAIRRLTGMDPARLDDLKDWLLRSDNRDFAAVVIRNGYIVLEVERGNSAKTDARRVASVSKAICATVLAIASEQSRAGKTPKRMSFDDLAFAFIPQAHPLSDPRKAQITVKQLLNHTSGICPEAMGAPNDGAWEYILGHSGDPRTANLAFAPGTACGYSTHALCHAALVCENVTGKPYDEFAIESLFAPLGCEHWWFQYYENFDKTSRGPSHGMGMPARDLARIAYCMLHGGRWEQQQVIPAWFVGETAAPTHKVLTSELRFKIPAATFSHAWELPAQLTGENNTPRGAGIPEDARYKPGSGGQLIAFVPSLSLIVTRQTGGSGAWEYAEYLRRACLAVETKPLQH